MCQGNEGQRNGNMGTEGQAATKAICRVAVVCLAVWRTWGMSLNVHPWSHIGNLALRGPIVESEFEEKNGSPTFIVGKMPERFNKYCSHSVSRAERAVFLGFGFVSAQSQAAVVMLLRQSLAKTQKSSLRAATLFLKTLQGVSSSFAERNWILAGTASRLGAGV
jgi:hypothetical protein